MSAGQFNWRQRGWPKPTAIGDLQALERQCATVRVGDGMRLECRLSDFTVEPLNEPLNEPFWGFNEGMKDWLVKLIERRHGVRLPYLRPVVGAGASTVRRTVAALAKAGGIEHRGGKKTGGCFVVEGGAGE